MADPPMRRALIEFELALDAGAADELRAEDWGRAFLAPSLPLLWHSTKIVLERADGDLASIEALADAALAGFAHRTVVVLDETDGARLADEAETTPGWEAERIRYLVWRPDQPATGPAAIGPAAIDPAGVRSKPSQARISANAADRAPATVRSERPDPGRGANGEDRVEVREVKLAALEPLRRGLTLESLPEGGHDPAETTDQLLELDRRIGMSGGDRWFVAPADDPASSCRLLRDDRGVGQVEDVATLATARGRGLATAAVAAALQASREAKDTTTFITADAADWPQFLYEKLGFTPIGDLHILRRRSSP